jgi:uncharacterized protein
MVQDDRRYRIMSNHVPNTSLVVFAKSPILGTVKTRMQPRLSEEHCLRLHQALLQYTLTKVAEWELHGLSKTIFFTDSGQEARSAIHALSIPTDVSVEFQVGRDLGERMTFALCKKWDEGFRKVLFIGTDCPLIEVTDLRDAIEGLTTREIVIGPATDGGYYLIGFSALRPFVLSGIDWGTQRVYKQTVQLLRTHSTKWLALRESFDLDTFDDLVRFHRTLSEAELMSPNLRELFNLVECLIQHAQAKQRH